MPEIVREASRAGALHDAIEVVTDKGRQPWKFVGWTINPHAFWKGQNVYTGMKGMRLHHTLGWQNFTIRHDYDYAGGLRQAGGKGYHTNVELPHEKWAFTTSHQKEYAEDCWKFLSERITCDGDEAAADWFMGFFGRDS